MKNRAFTLIELLVVIAIIAVLMGILMPVLGAARKQAWQTVCQANLRSIGAAGSLYAHDNDNSVPRGAISFAQDPEYIWFLNFMPYLAHEKDQIDYRDVKIFRCPAYPDKRQTVCYVVNGAHFTDRKDRIGSEWSMSEFGRCNLIKYKRLNETIYLADHEFGSWRPIIERGDDPQLAIIDVRRAEDLPYTRTASGTVVNLNPSRRVASERHRKGTNVLYLDWHVDWMDSELMDIEMFQMHTR